MAHRTSPCATARSSPGQGRHKQTNRRTKSNNQRDNSERTTTPKRLNGPRVARPALDPLLTPTEEGGQREGVGDRARPPRRRYEPISGTQRLLGSLFSGRSSYDVAEGQPAGISRSSGPGIKHSCPEPLLGGLRSASAALTLRVCLHACRVFSGSLSGLSPYDRGQRPGCNFYTALPRCGSILANAR